MMRIKISFDDVKKLYNYLDKDGKGGVGYDEFTLLLEERWRGIDPLSNLKKVSGKNPMQTSSRQTLNIVKDCPNDEEAF